MGFCSILSPPRAPDASSIGLHRLALFTSILSLILLAFSVPNRAFAEQPSSLAGQYIRTDFTVEDGLPDDVVNAIFRAENGLLWVGTESGLATFDGREFRRIPLSFPGASNLGAVLAITKTSSGDLWIGTNAGLVRIAKRNLEQLTPEEMTFLPLGDEKSDSVLALLETRAGVLWVGTNHGLYRFADGAFHKVFGAQAIHRLAEALNGRLLVVTQKGFLEFDGEKAIEHPEIAQRLGVRDDEIFNVFQDQKGTTWYSTHSGIMRAGEHPFGPFDPPAAAKTPAYRTYEDAQGQIWISNDRGTFRVAGDDLEALTSFGARSLYADKDGDLWMGTNGQGLLHFKPRLIRMYTKSDGIPNERVMTVLATHDGKLWVGNGCGLSLFDHNRFKPYTEKDGLLNSCVWALAEDHNNDLWIGSYNGGLFKFHGGRFTQYAIAQGLASNIVRQIVVARDNSLWIATPDGLSHMKDGHFTNYTTAHGLRSDRILSVHQDDKGDVWAATQAGLARLAGDRFESVPSSSLKEDTSTVRFAEDSLGNLYTSNLPKGISLLRQSRLEDVNDDLNVMDMVESPHHDLWFSSMNGIIRIGLNDLKRAARDRDTPLDYTLFDRTDGLNSTQASAGIPNIAMTPDEKLWIATVRGLAMVDLKQIPSTGSRPTIFVGEVTVDGKKQPTANQVVIPPGTHHIELHLTSVELRSPQKARLQYRMDGVDSVWLDADDSRTATYTALPAGQHVFHVRATGRDGRWDLSGIEYGVTQQPLFYQKPWFQLTCAAFLVAVFSAAYLARVSHLVRQTRMVLEARIAERERIARDLHDTFLQSIQGILLRFHASSQRLAKDDRLRLEFEEVLEQSDAVMSQGRGLVSGLRMAPGAADDLPIAFVMAGKEFGALSPTAYKVIVTGEPRKLNPLVYDEIVKIGREALFNAYRHAKAAKIETELDYTPSDLRLRFRDDGAGIDPGIMAHGGRAGHYGLPGMRERAHKIGAKLDIYSRLGAGTEIELRIPAKVAYLPAHESRGHWLQRIFGGEAV
jgi:ligand-binding sensor domain-containing protein/signal transduction histidine kinase